MATSGTVTITAKMNSEDAERRLQALARAEREMGTEATRSNAMRAQSASIASDSYEKLSRQSQSTSVDVMQLGVNLSVLGVAALEAKEHLHLTQTAISAVSIASRGPLPILAGLAAVVIAAKSAADGLEYLSETAVPAAGRAEAALASLRIVTERTGGNVAETTKHVEGLEDALTGLTTAAEATRTLNSMGVSLERQAELIDAMRDGIVAMGGDVNTQLPLMALAIKRQEGELLDNMGVVSTVEMMYKTYAATIGTTSDKLNQHQREEAVIQGVLQETAKYTGAAASAMETYQGRIAALATEQQKLAKEAGELVMPFANIGTEIDRLGVKIERHIIRRLKEIGSPASGLAHDAQQALKSIWDQDYLMPRLSEQQQGEAAMVDKTIKKLQAHNEEERKRQAQAAREGGYGPANTADTNKAYEERAKQQQAAEERASQASKQHAEEQKRQRQALQDELLTIGKAGGDLELAQEQIRHRKEMETAAGAHKNLELEQERHRRALQVINAKYPPLVMSGSNSDAAAYGRMHVGTVGNLQASTFGGRMGLGKLSEGLGRNLGSSYENALDGWKASQGQAIPEAALQQVEADLTVPIANAFEKGAEAGMERAVRSLMDGDFGGLGAGLLGTVKDSAATALTDAAKVALGDAAILATAKSLALAAASAVIFAAPFVAAKAEKDRDKQAQDNWMDQKANATQQGLNSMPTNTPAFDMSTGQFTKLGASAETAAEAVERHASRMEDATYALDNFWRKIDQGTKDFETWEGKKGGAEDAFTRFMVESGKWTDEDVQKRALTRSLDWMVGGTPNNPDFSASNLTVEQLTSIDPRLLDPNNRDVGSISRALGMPDAAGPGAYSDDRLLEAIKIAFGIKADQERVGPGSTPDRPLYSSIVNFKDMMAFFAPGELFRAQGPGTSRGDGMKSRAVSTRAI